MPMTYNPATQKYTQTAAPAKKPRKCEFCGSDRPSTKLSIPMVDQHGRPAGKHPCNGSFHDPETAPDTKIGGANRTPDPTRSQPF